MRAVVGFLVSIALAICLLGATWATYPSSALPWNLETARFAQMEQAANGLEAYPFLTMIDERAQAASWSAWIQDRSAKSEIFRLGANRMLQKLVKLSAAVIGGILLAFSVRFVAKAVFGKARGHNWLLGRLALVLIAAFVVSFLLPVAVANHVMTMIYSLPLLIGFIIASTGKDKQAPPPAAPPYGAGPFGPPPGYGPQGSYPQGPYSGGPGPYQPGPYSGGPGYGPQGPGQPQ